MTLECAGRIRVPGLQEDVQNRGEKQGPMMIRLEHPKGCGKNDRSNFIGAPPTLQRVVFGRKPDDGGG